MFGMEAPHGQVLSIASPETYLSYLLHFGGLCSQTKLLPGCFPFSSFFPFPLFCPFFLSFFFLMFISLGKGSKSLSSFGGN